MSCNIPADCKVPFLLPIRPTEFAIVAFMSVAISLADKVLFHILILLFMNSYKIKTKSPTYSKYACTGLLAPEHRLPKRAQLLLILITTELYDPVETPF